MTFFVTAQTAFHHCTFRFITAHFVHHCTLKQALNITITFSFIIHTNRMQNDTISMNGRQQVSTGVEFSCRQPCKAPVHAIRLI